MRRWSGCTGTIEATPELEGGKRRKARRFMPYAVIKVLDFGVSIKVYAIAAAMIATTGKSKSPEILASVPM
jgi:hypothetical protein